MKKQTPKISVILPSYNGEKYIGQSIQSVIDQTEQDWELIIVNDCSTDNTLKICESFANKDKRIKVISNKINKKLPASLNVGFSVARGKYLTWTSDDNFYRPDAFEKMADYLDCHKDIDLISMAFDVLDEKDNFLYTAYVGQEYKRCQAALICGNNIGAAFMYRKSVADKIGEYDTGTFCAEDYDYWCRIALNGKIGYVSDNVYVYRLQSNSLTATKQTQIQEKTKYIQHKYANAFFNKFKFTESDKIKFYVNVLHEIPHEHKQKIRFNRFIAKYFVSLLFFSSKLRHKIKNRLLLKDKYSFSQPNKEC